MLKPKPIGGRATYFEQIPLSLAKKLIRLEPPKPREPKPGRVSRKR